MNTDFFKVYGAKERNDSLLRLSDDHYVLFYGFHKDNESDESGYCWRKDYGYKPTESELKEDIVEHINKLTDAKILTGFTYEGSLVYLSAENQFNYKAAFDLCMLTDGGNLPVTFKFGQENDPKYRQFNTKEELREFYLLAVSFVSKTLAEGWAEKDMIYKKDMQSWFT
jgi:hypothetical protein